MRAFSSSAVLGWIAPVLLCLLMFVPTGPPLMADAGQQQDDVNCVELQNLIDDLGWEIGDLFIQSNLIPLQILQANDELAELEERMTALDIDMRNLIILQAPLPLLQAKQKQIDELEKEIEQKQQQIADLEKQEDEVKAKLQLKLTHLADMQDVYDRNCGTPLPPVEDPPVPSPDPNFP